MVGRILKDIFCGELAAGKWITDRPHLRLVNVCKRNITALDINMESWACLEADHRRWRRTLNQKLQSEEEKLMKAEADKRARRKRSNNPIRPRTSVTFEAMTVTLTCVAAWIGGRLAEGML